MCRTRPSRTWTKWAFELAGNGSLFAVSHTTFDYLGSGVGSTSTLITLNGIQQSTITLVDVTYSSTTGNKYNYNYTILNSSAGLSWTNQQYSGKLAGANNSFNDKTQLHVVWQNNNSCQAMQNVGTGSGRFEHLEHRIYSDQMQRRHDHRGQHRDARYPTATASTTTINGTLKFSRTGDNEFNMVGGSMSSMPAGPWTWVPGKPDPARDDRLPYILYRLLRGAVWLDR